MKRIDEAVRNHSGVISTQVLGEFFHSLVVRKQLLKATEAERAVNDFANGLDVSDVTLPVTCVAVEVVSDTKTVPDNGT